MKIKPSAALALASAITVVGCGASASEAPAPEQPITPGVEIIHFGPGNFRDVATVCNNGNRVYQDDFNSDNALRIVANDPSCKQ